MTAEPDKQPTPEELIREIEERMEQSTWSIPEFVLRVSGLCWILFALALALFVPLGQIGQNTAPTSWEGPGKETITVMEDGPKLVFTTNDWIMLAAAVLFLAWAGWGMLRARRWASLPGCAGSLAGIAWMVAGAWEKGGPGTWGLVLLVAILLAAAPLSVWRAWWSLR